MAILDVEAKLLAFSVKSEVLQLKAEQHPLLAVDFVETEDLALLKPVRLCNRVLCA